MLLFCCDEDVADDVDVDVETLETKLIKIKLNFKIF